MNTETEYEFISNVLMGNQDAIRMANELFFVYQIWDDFIDKDKDIAAETFNRMMWTVLVDLPLNPFYIAHFSHLAPIIRSGIIDWFDSNIIEAETDEQKRENLLKISFIIRCNAGSLLSHMALLIGGYDWMRKVSPQVREWIHDESFEEYVREITSRHEAKKSPGLKVVPQP
jgi:hypothetical protein